MASRKEYTDCMVPWMTGGGPDRKERFCIGAKVCSKGVSQEEGARLCAEAAANPKPPRVQKIRRGKVDTDILATCIIKGLDGSEPTLANLNKILAGCSGQKPKPPTREKFIKQCFKENTAGDGFQYDIKEAQRLRSFCTAKWKEQEQIA